MKNMSFEAVIFDMDGVITKTAVIHATAWKKMFDEYLRGREKKYGESFREFIYPNDYLTYVDGKPRYEGVVSFLESRGIELPFGDVADAPEAETICGLGNRKNEAFNKIIENDGVEVFPSTVTLINTLKRAGIKLGVASSGKNCKPVLEAVNLLEIFGARVDGAVLAEMGLQGKPEPDIFTTTCKILDTLPAKSIVVEDAVAGVCAGARGKFGLVLGIARENNAVELQQNGADFVVSDLEEINGLPELNALFLKYSGK
ncbi:MAG TPA: beta-phosphoglucomutase family hydrolase [Draconibacterium sp.]|nr:beta-phosphoglucomutase family hydrolase [Draconibacterium sp.]